MAYQSNYTRGEIAVAYARARWFGRRSRARYASCCLASLQLRSWRGYVSGTVRGPLVPCASPPCWGQVSASTYAGGHTTELLALLSTLPKSEYEPFVYTVSSGDTFSLAKAQAFEEARRGSPKLAAHPLQALEIPRARSVGQSWLTTPFTLAWSFLFCILHIGIAPLVSCWTHATPLPVVDVVLMNGPATCVPVVLVAHMLRVRPKSDLVLFFALAPPRLYRVVCACPLALPLGQDLAKDCRSVCGAMALGGSQGHMLWSACIELEKQ